HQPLEGLIRRWRALPAEGRERFARFPTPYRFVDHRQQNVPQLRGSFAPARRQQRVEFVAAQKAGPHKIQEQGIYVPRLRPTKGIHPPLPFRRPGEGLAYPLQKRQPEPRHVAHPLQIKAMALPPAENMHRILPQAGTRNRFPPDKPVGHPFDKALAPLAVGRSHGRVDGKQFVPEPPVGMPRSDTEAVQDLQQTGRYRQSLDVTPAVVVYEQVSHRAVRALVCGLDLRPELLEQLKHQVNDGRPAPHSPSKPEKLDCRPGSNGPLEMPPTVPPRYTGRYAVGLAMEDPKPLAACVHRGQGQEPQRQGTKGASAHTRLERRIKVHDAESEGQVVLAQLPHTPAWAPSPTHRTHLAPGCRSIYTRQGVRQFIFQGTQEFLSSERRLFLLGTPPPMGGIHEFAVGENKAKRPRSKVAVCTYAQGLVAQQYPLKASYSLHDMFGREFTRLPQSNGRAHGGDPCVNKGMARPADGL